MVLQLFLSGFSLPVVRQLPACPRAGGLSGLVLAPQPPGPLSCLSFGATGSFSWCLLFPAWLVFPPSPVWATSGGMSGPPAYLHMAGWGAGLLPVS